MRVPEMSRVDALKPGALGLERGGAGRGGTAEAMGGRGGEQSRVLKAAAVGDGLGWRMEASRVNWVGLICNRIEERGMGA